MILEPPRPWLELRFGKLWTARDLILLFVRRGFVATYKQTVLGPIWYLIQANPVAPMVEAFRTASLGLGTVGPPAPTDLARVP